jgi:hypothetical protein
MEYLGCLGTLVASAYSIHNNDKNDQQEIQAACMVLPYLHSAKLGTY